MPDAEPPPGRTEGVPAAAATQDAITAKLSVCFVKATTGRGGPPRCSVFKHLFDHRVDGGPRWFEDGGACLGVAPRHHTRLAVGRIDALWPDPRHGGVQRPLRD